MTPSDEIGVDVPNALSWARRQILSTKDGRHTNRLVLSALMFNCLHFSRTALTASGDLLHVLSALRPVYNDSPFLNLLIAATYARHFGTAPHWSAEYINILRSESRSLSLTYQYLINEIDHVGGSLSYPPDGNTQPDEFAKKHTDKEELSQILSALEAQTLFGLNVVVVSPLTCELLPGALIAAIQRQDVVLSCRLMRTMIYLGIAERLCVRSFRNFTTSLQQFDGSFGHLDSFIAKKQNKQDVEIAIRVVQHLEVAWALVELDLPSFRTIRDLGRINTNEVVP